MEVKNWTYEAFPAYEGLPEGAERLATTGDEMGSYYIPDVVYATVDGIELRMQILFPLTRNEPFGRYPCIVFAQGSGWMPQDCHHNVGRAGKLAERGFVVAIMQYRHAGEAAFPAQIQDAKNAVRFLRKHAAHYHVDPDKMILAGSSSGGHTAVFAAITGEGGPFDRDLFPGISASVSAVVDFYGAVSLEQPDDFPTLTDRGQPDSLDTFLLTHVPEEEQADFARRATALHYITPETSVPPVFIVHGTKDRVVNVRQSVAFYEKLRACGHKAELLLLEDADHGGPEFWTDAVLDRVAEFLALW